jgi:hypothetical protein
LEVLIFYGYQNFLPCEHPFLPCLFLSFNLRIFSYWCIQIYQSLLLWLARFMSLKKFALLRLKMKHNQSIH